MAMPMMKRGSSALITIRRGHEVICVHSLDLAERILFGSSDCPQPGDDHGLLAAASSAAKSCLEMLVRSFPLVDHATSSFGTALRVQAVRSRLAPITIRKIPLLKILDYLRSAADADRHLTCELIRDAVSALSAELAQPSSDSEHVRDSRRCANDVRNRDDMDRPALDHDPWAEAAAAITKHGVISSSVKTWRPTTASLWSNWRPSERYSDGGAEEADRLERTSEHNNALAPQDSTDEDNATRVQQQSSEENAAPEQGEMGEPRDAHPEEEETSAGAAVNAEKDVDQGDLRGQLLRASSPYQWRRLAALACEEEDACRCIRLLEGIT